MADIPGLYEDLDVVYTLNANLSWDSSLVNNILDKCLKNLSKLESCLWVWKAHNPEPFLEVEFSSMSGLTVNEDGDLFPTVSRYSSLGIANELAVYYSMQMQLLSI
jgi:hypothetical protein